MSSTSRSISRARAWRRKPILHCDIADASAKQAVARDMGTGRLVNEQSLTRGRFGCADMDCMAEDLRLRDGFAAAREPSQRHPTRPGIARLTVCDLCRARPRHQQLPSFDCASVARRIPRHRSVFAHHPARRVSTATRHISEAAIERAVGALSVCGDKIHAKGAGASARSRRKPVVPPTIPMPSSN